MAILFYPLANDGESALGMPKGHAARAREAEALAERLAALDAGGQQA